jgi:hydrogenase-4 component B
VSGVLAAAMIALLAGPALCALAARLGAAATLTGCVLVVIAGFAAALHGAQPVLSLGGWLGFGPSALRDDPLAGIFLALGGVCGGAVALAALSRPPTRMQGALGGGVMLCVAVVILAGNGFALLLAWEGLAVCILLLAGGDPARLSGGYLTAGLTKLGGAALLAAVGLLYAHTHSFSLAVWAHAHLSAAARGVAFALTVTAFGSKVGILPLQSVLPEGYGSAPRLGASWLAVALCAGFYGLWRFELALLHPLGAWCGDALLVLGALGAVAGIVYAVCEDELRRFLGYSTVEHAGIVLLGLGVALLGLSFHDRTLAAAGMLAATLHVIAHNLAKTLALLALDRLELATGERALGPLGALARGDRSSAGALGIASLTLAAIPPFGGFVSEWLTFMALLQAFRMPSLLSQLLCALAAAALAFTGGIALLAFAKAFGFAFLGAARRLGRRLRAAGGPPLELGALGLVLAFLGTVAPWEIHAVGAGLRGVLGFDLARQAITHPLVLGPVFRAFSVLAPTWLTVVLPGYALLALALALATRRRAVRRAPVWLTGSGAELAEVQYRPAAYSNPLRVVLRGPLRFRSRLLAADRPPARPEPAAPAQPEPAAPAAPRWRLQRDVVQVIERLLYRPLALAALAGSARARRLQSGRLSMYLLYLMVALMIALVLIPVLR